MVPFLTDKDLHGPMVVGLRLHHPDLSIVRAVEVGLSGLDEDILLDWAAQHGRILVSHDVPTTTDSATVRVSSGRKMSGLNVVPQSLGTARAIADLRFVAGVCTDEEMENATVWLPL